MWPLFVVVCDLHIICNWKMPTLRAYSSSSEGAACPRATRGPRSQWVIPRRFKQKKNCDKQKICDELTNEGTDGRTDGRTDVPVEIVI